MRRPDNILEERIDARACRLGVSRFALAMTAKLDEKRGEGRRQWNIPSACTIEELRKMLRQHFDRGRGDPVDIANFAMMIWNRQHPRGKEKP